MRAHIVALAAALAPRASSYPSMVSCNEPLEVGRTWMGAGSVASGKTMEVLAVAENRLVACGSTVAAGTVLRPRIAGIGGDQFLVEATGLTDFGTACGGSRSWSSADTFVASLSTELRGAHAPGYGAVYVTETCALRVEGDATDAPSPTPAVPSPTAVGCASDRPGYDFMLELDGVLTLHWSLVLEKAGLKAALEVRGGGWASFGWGDGGMVGAECVIGEPGAIPGKFRLTSLEKSGVKALAPTLEEISTSIDGESLVYAFTKLLEEENELTVGADKFVWARGAGSLGYHGSRVGVLSLNLETCAARRVSTKTVNARAMRAHGGLLVAAFAASLPLGVAAARGRRAAPPGDATWLRVPTTRADSVAPPPPRRLEAAAARRPIFSSTWPRSRSRRRRWASRGARSSAPTATARVSGPDPFAPRLREARLFSRPAESRGRKSSRKGGSRRRRGRATSDDSEGGGSRGYSEGGRIAARPRG